MPATEKQINFAQRIAQTLGADIPAECYESVGQMKEWIDENMEKVEKDDEGRCIFKPSDKQTAFAERIADALGLTVPGVCYTDAHKISEWIDAHMEDYRAANPRNNRQHSGDDTL